MSFCATLITRLKANASLVTLVANRIYPVQLKQQDTLPAIRFNIVAAVATSAMGSDIGIIRYTYQFDVFTTTYTEQDAILVQMKASLVRWRQSGVQGSFWQGNENDSYDDELRVYRKRFDIEFIVEE